jgi:hypothetical protein
MVAALALSVVGCADGYTVEQTPRPLTLQGTLDGGPVSGFECFWLVDASGGRTDVMYPAGWEPKLNPVRLLDPSGAVVARRGDRLVVTGPEGIGESVCAPDVFVAETVRVIP